MPNAGFYGLPHSKGRARVFEGVLNLAKHMPKIPQLSVAGSAHQLAGGWDIELAIRVAEAPGGRIPLGEPVCRCLFAEVNWSAQICL